MAKTSWGIFERTRRRGIAGAVCAVMGNGDGNAFGKRFGFPLILA
jgi:hypothetical protein